MSRLATTLVLTVLATACTAQTATESDSQGAAISAAAKEPMALTGEFRFAGQVQPIARLTVDVIDTRMPDATERLEASRAEGGACRLVLSNTWRCTKMHPASDVPAASLDAIALRNQNVFATFGAVTSSPSIVTDAESLTEWQISQRGSSQLGAFDHYRYLDLSGDLVKIVLPGTAETESMELILKDQDHLGKWDSKVTTVNRWRWHEDMAFAILQH